MASKVWGCPLRPSCCFSFDSQRDGPHVYLISCRRKNWLWDGSYEIGAMNVTQQIDALRALGTSPIRVLVVPRLIASMLSLPILTAISSALGVIGGLIVCLNDFDMGAGLYLYKVTETVKFYDYLSGLVKSSIFGGIITIVACYRAFRTSEGTRGVGESTTWVVVSSSILILIANFFISKIFSFFGYRNE